MNTCQLTTLFVLVLFTFYATAQNQKDLLTQVSTIDALLSGIYDGEVSIGELLKKGSFGIGTFNHLDGEMVILDGVCYQIRSNGMVSSVNNTYKTPFAAVTPFEADTSLTILETLSLEKLESIIDGVIPTKNIFYALRISGRFASASTRSVPMQKQPYPLLPEIVKNQPIFSFKNKNGTLVGFRCPVYVKGINVPGYHLHFLSGDKKSGGHLLSCVSDSITIDIDYTDSFSVILPHDSAFAVADFTGNTDEALKKVEKK